MTSSCGFIMHFLLFPIIIFICYINCWQNTVTDFVHLFQLVKYTETCSYTLNRMCKNNKSVFVHQSWQYGEYLSWRAWGSANGCLTMSTTPNYPCLIASVELNHSWEGFSTTEKIPWLGKGGGRLCWIRNKAVALSWPIGLEGLR